MTTTNIGGEHAVRISDLAITDISGEYAGGIGGVGDLYYLGEDDHGNLYVQADIDPLGMRPVYRVNNPTDPSRREFVPVEWTE